MKKIVCGLVLGIILCSGIVYGAYLYNASDVSYSNDETTATNVHDALDDLFLLTNKLKEGENLISNFSTTTAKTFYSSSKATATFTSTQNIDFSKYDFLTINYTVTYVNRPRAAIVVAGTEFQVCPYSGTYNISIPVSNIDTTDNIKFYITDSGGGTDGVHYVQITVNSIYGY